MSDQKFKVLTEILKFNRPFKSNELADTIGISRQLANYHLRELLKQDLLEQEHSTRFYKVIDQEAFVNQLVHAASSSHVPELPELKLINVEALSALAQQIVVMRHLRLPGHSEVRRAFEAKVKDYIEVLQGQIVYAREKKLTAEKAAQWMYSEAGGDFGVLYDRMERHIPMAKNDWVELTSKVVNDEL